MILPLKIGIVGGGGWLGGAIAQAILDAGIVLPDTLSLSYRREKPEDLRGCHWTNDNQDLADRSDVIIMSVRPGDWHDIELDAAGKLVISVMAGIKTDALCEHHQTTRVVRSLPNAAAEVRKSYTPWFASDAVDETDRAIVRAVFGACGVQDEVANETDIDYLTGLSGAGPAFPALLAAAMMTDATARGIDPKIAQRAVNAVLVGAGRILEKREESPDATVENFLHYNGTTASAITAMRARGFDAAVAGGLTAALSKSLQMGNDS